MKAIVLLITCLISYTSFANKTPVVLISIDGFANNYLSTHKAPNINAFHQNGVVAKAMNPVFPSKTFPNHLSIVTGDYPQEHGIVHNRFYHRELNRNYKLGAGKNDNKWLSSKPIWVYAAEQGVKSGIYFWPESEAEIAGQRPTHYFQYKKGTSNKKRIDQIIEWLSLAEDERPQFIASYFSIVDDAGHSFGLDAPQTASAIKEVDSLIATLQTAIKEKFDGQVNLIIVSDHGMTASGREHAMFIKDLLPAKNDDVIVVNGQTQLYIYGDGEQLKKTKARLESQAFVEGQQRYNVYKFNEFPSHWKFNREIAAMPDLIANANPPYTFVNAGDHLGLATHGYDPKDNPALSAIFLAQGPNFKAGQTLEAFDNIHVFALLSHLLDLDVTESKPAKLETFRPVLK